MAVGSALWFFTPQLGTAGEQMEVATFHNFTIEEQFVKPEGPFWHGTVVVLLAWALGCWVYCVFDTLFVKVLGASQRSFCGDRDVLQARWVSTLRTLPSNHEKIDI